MSQLQHYDRPVFLQVFLLCTDTGFFFWCVLCYFVLNLRVFSDLSPSGTRQGGGRGRRGAAVPFLPTEHAGGLAFWGGTLGEPGTRPLGSTVRIDLVLLAALPSLHLLFLP